MNASSLSGPSSAHAGGMLSGLAASAGIARGRAFICACGDIISVPRRFIPAAAVNFELDRFARAVNEAEADLFTLRETTRANLGNEPAAIFDAQAAMLRDPALYNATARRCRDEQINIEAALSMTADALNHAFAQLDDATVRERAADLRDVTRRILGRLLSLPSERRPCFPADSIVVTRELLPSLAAELGRVSIRGIVAEQGGPTAHAVILARSLGIPTLLYVENATTRIRTGDSLILDGVAGRVFIRPPPSVESEYERHEANLAFHRTLLKASLELPAETRDGVNVSLNANIGKVADAAAAARFNAAGVGLYRTEFVFMVEDHFPSEEEQYQTYRKSADCLAGRDMVIRMLDVGSDKVLPYFPLPAEVNPSLGQRGTRLLLNHPEILHPQLRAILRLGATHPVAVLFPMIGSVDEIFAIKTHLQRLETQLRAEHLPCNPHLRIGAMIETPSAVLTAQAIAREVDFLSIGTNDLTQYLLVSDRSSRTMASYYDPLHPAVMLAIKTVVAAAAAEGKPVSVCGEMAGNPAYTELLLGLGIRSLSIAPGELLEIKRTIRSLTLTRAHELAQRVLGCRTIAGIKHALASARRNIHRPSTSRDLSIPAVTVALTVAVNPLDGDRRPPIPSPAALSPSARLLQPNPSSS